MGLAVLGDLLRESPSYINLLGALQKQRAVTRTQVLSDATPFTLATLWRDLQVPMLVIVPRPEEARRVADQAATWSGKEESVLLFPESEVLPFERITSDAETTQSRLRTLATLLGGESAPLVVASANAVAQKTVDLESFRRTNHTLRVNETIDMDELLDRWRSMGYAFEPTVLQPGTVSRRGGIIDIFPVGAAEPSRIELWGNEIDSIRRFDAATQRSSEPVDEVHVIAAAETLPSLAGRDTVDSMLSGIDISNCTLEDRERFQEEFDQLLNGYSVEEPDYYAGFFNKGSLLDYFPERGLLVLYRPGEIAETAWDMDERTQELREVKQQRGALPYRFPSSHLLWSEVELLLDGSGPRLDVTPWGADELLQEEVFSLPFMSTSGYYGKLERFATEARELSEAGNRVVAATSLPKRLGEILDENGVRAGISPSLTEPPEPGSVTVLQTTGGNLGDGFSLSVNGHNLVVFSDADIFGVAKQRRVRRSKGAAWDALLSELHPGDYVVHVEHGIAKFIGTGRAAEDSSETEYLILQYAAGDRLFVPMAQMDRISPYMAPMDRAPTLSRLGTQEWRRTKARVERSTKEMAAELLSLYANRELVTGHEFLPDGAWLAELEDSFPFEETADQVKAIAEVKGDMEHGRPMDRLVCGDVGYGKTEIALRAAFKAVLEGKQVAVLVPTTVLAQQHYVTFSQRLSAYPVNVEVLSRFRSDKEQRDVVEGLASGSVDICVGTHRLVQRDVRFKDLGLVIVDEEQRFGVAHKERLKQMRSEVDVLTLTATPIPRTLHMSLAGVRDLSTIETPPEERLPIKTYVSEFSDQLVREAILREIDRQGQVFFLHNRVQSIANMADHIRRLVPEAEVGIAHGQMPERQLEETMAAFALNEMDVLVCTTIIESGLDIPNVNTLIINRADTFGLAQLYQLRGRVGRGARRAYGYLLIPPHRSLTETAEKRLKTMLAATELGAGFRIAMKDLEIRGAGNILGSAQSGHIHSVGFELYTRMLSEAVEQLRAQRASGQTNGTNEGQILDEETALNGAADTTASLLQGNDRPAAESDVGVNLGVPANVPADYVTDMPTRLGLYQRLAAAHTVEEVDTMGDEMRDRFGPLPWQTENLLYLMRLKARCRTARVESIRRDESVIVMQLRDDVGGARRPLQRVLGPAVKVGNTQLRISQDGVTAAGWEDLVMETVLKLTEFRERVLAEV